MPETNNLGTNSQIILREITQDDRKIIDQAALLEMAAFPDPWSSHEIRSTIKQRHTFCTAAMEGDTLLGYYFCYYVLDECEIARIAVAKEQRRRGIGQLLFGHMLKVCRKKQLTKMLLDVRKSNQPAISFYEKNGFVSDGERKLYYGGRFPEDALLMSCVIPSVSTGNSGEGTL